jgi:hypothetical protein
MPRTRGSWAFWLTAWALCWSVILLVGAFVADAYESEQRSSDGRVVRESDTLVGANGLWVAGLLAVPVALTLAAGIGLRARRRRGGGAVTWGVVAALGCFAFVSLPSIGFLLLPIPLLLAVAAALTRAPRERSR